MRGRIIDRCLPRYMPLRKFCYYARPPRRLDPRARLWDTGRVIPRPEPHPGMGGADVWIDRRVLHP